MVPPPSSDQGNTIDAAAAKFLSDLDSRTQLSLTAFVRQVRGQTLTDGRPNIALYEVPLPSNSSPQSLYRQWNEIAREGVRPKWTNNATQVQLIRPPNHKSAITNPQSVRRDIRKGQCDGKYLVLNESVLQLWPELVVSPVGVIDKAGDDTRMINDYSYPRGSLVNEVTDRANFQSISYNPPRDIARRIYELRIQYPGKKVLIMLGDISGAFRHVPVRENAVYRFTFVYDGYVVVDLSCGFGWCGLPAFYSLAGLVINDLYESTTLTEKSGHELGRLHGNLWCDDHTCVEVNRSQRCQAANSALRLAMATVLGPAAINDRKVTAWTHKTKLSVCSGTQKTVLCPFQTINWTRQAVALTNSPQEDELHGLSSTSYLVL
ncbi:hypothetical protein F444_02249 [Phytophthora nicotianae P1976]|uniref:Reverse transcriptase domain-containing protein n=1 Tax=Phytophthora nicotianae P1976 TaxID=1317066 RepID=A0A081AY22_PHYNI|nr:hypothetical protein F444_02249 [Phytophthora nicotianae P1976]